MKNYMSNIPLLYIYSIFIKRVSMPIIVVYFLINNLSYLEIGTLAAVMSVMTLLTEVHGGAFADIHGKKSSLLLHSFFGGLTMLFYFIGNSFPVFLLGSISYGIAGAFISGTRNALIYDSLAQHKRTKEYKKYLGRQTFWSHLVNAIVLLLIPIIYTFNNKLPFLIGIVFFLVSGILAYFLIEPPMTKKSHKRLTALNITVKKAYYEIRESKKISVILFVSLIINTLILTVSEFKQPLLLISGLNIIYFGVVYALMRSFMGFSAAITYKLEKYFDPKSMILLGFFLIFVSYLGFAFGFGIWIILAIILLSFTEGLNRIVIDDEINKNIKPNQRTTILSINSLLKSLTIGFLVLIYGILADYVGVQEVFIIAIGPGVLISLIAIYYFYKMQDPKRSVNKS